MFNFVNVDKIKLVKEFQEENHHH